MSKNTSLGLKIVLGVNCLAFVGFVLVLVIQLPMTDLDVRMNYTSLDREGIINLDVLAKERPDLAKHDRSAVPRYIAGPAMAGQRVNAALGLLLAGFNILIAGGFLIWPRRGRSAAAETVAESEA